MSTKLGLKVSWPVRIKNKFSETRTHKISETNSSFHMK